MFILISFLLYIYFLKIFIVIFRFQTKTHIWISKQVVHFLFPLNNPYFTVVLVLFLVCNHYLDYHLTVIPEGLRHATVQVLHLEKSTLNFCLGLFCWSVFTSTIYSLSLLSTLTSFHILSISLIKRPFRLAERKNVVPLPLLF